MIQVFPGEIIVLSDETPPIDDVDDGKSDGKENARNRVDLAHRIDNVAFGQCLAFAFLAE